MRHCLFCDHALGVGVPEAPAPGRRHAYDPALGRLWEICPQCRRWNPVPLELRWETLEGWERAVRDRGRVVLEAGDLALFRVDDGEVVRVGRPPLVVWGGWRYGDRLPAPEPPKPGFLARLLGGLPPPPLEGYDPYGLGGPMGGVAGSQGPSGWLGSPFLERAHPLTLAFASIPFAPECPACGGPMPLHPWDFHRVHFTDSDAAHRVPAAHASPSVGAEPIHAGLVASCALCGTEVVVPLDRARPALRMGLSILDTGPAAREVGEAAGAALDRVGGTTTLLQGLARLGAPLGELGRTERVALGIALDARAEADALGAEWREAEELAAITDGELTEVPGFLAFRDRVLGEGS
jgi:hypothetical protein